MRVAPRAAPNSFPKAVIVAESSDGRVRDRGFPRASRLLTGSDYRRVFDAHPRRYADRYFTLLVATSQSSGPVRPRLGLAISRKQVRRAVDRNRLKRLIRDAFRHRQIDLPPVDIVVMARSAACQVDNAALALCLDRHMDAVARRKPVIG